MARPAPHLITDDAGSVSVAEYFTDNTAATEDEALRRAYSLGQRAIDQME